MPGKDKEEDACRREESSSSENCCPSQSVRALFWQKDNQQLTDEQFTRITRTLAEPRRVRILREIAAHGNSIPLACLLRRHQVSPATLSHHASELDNSGLVEIVRHGRFVHLALRPDVWQAYLKRLSDLIDGSELRIPTEHVARYER